MDCENVSCPLMRDSIYSLDKIDGLSAGFLTNITDSTVSKGDSKFNMNSNASGVIWNPDSISSANMFRRFADVNWSSMEES